LFIDLSTVIFSLSFTIQFPVMPSCRDHGAAQKVVCFYITIKFVHIFHISNPRRLGLRARLCLQISRHSVTPCSSHYSLFHCIHIYCSYCPHTHTHIHTQTHPNTHTQTPTHTHTHTMWQFYYILESQVVSQSTEMASIGES